MFFCEKDIGKKDDFLGKCELSSSKVLAGWAKFFPFGEADAIDLKNIQSGDVTVTTGWHCRCFSSRNYVSANLKLVQGVENSFCFEFKNGPVRQQLLKLTVLAPIFTTPVRKRYFDDWEHSARQAKSQSFLEIVGRQKDDSCDLYFQVMGFQVLQRMDPMIATPTSTARGVDGELKLQVRGWGWGAICTEYAHIIYNI